MLFVDSQFNTRHVICWSAYSMHMIQLPSGNSWKMVWTCSQHWPLRSEYDYECIVTWQNNWVPRLRTAEEKKHYTQNVTENFQTVQRHTVKVHPRTDHEGPEREYRYGSTLPLTSAPDGVDGQRHAPAALPPGKTQYPLHRRLGGPQGRSGRVRKISPPSGFDPRAVQPVASRYTDWAIPALVQRHILRENFLHIHVVCGRHSLDFTSVKAVKMLHRRRKMLLSHWPVFLP